METIKAHEREDCLTFDAYPHLGSAAARWGARHASMGRDLNGPGPQWAGASMGRGLNGLVEIAAHRRLRGFCR
jgi:hypothetical protein